MPTWMSEIMVNLLTRLASWAFAKAAAYIQERQEKAASDSVIEARLDAVKIAYKEAFNGEKPTPEQMAALRRAISGFIRNPDNGGL